MQGLFVTQRDNQVTARLMRLWILALGLAVIGCSTRTPIDPSYAAEDSGIAGHLVRTRLVDSAVQGTGAARGIVTVRSADLAQVAARVATDEDGNFRVGLRPGNYFVYTETQELGPYGRRVAVVPHRITRVQLDLPPGQ